MQVAHLPRKHLYLDILSLRRRPLLRPVCLLVATGGAVVFMLCAPGSARAQKPDAVVNDSHELVTGQTKILVTPEQRQTATNLLEDVQRNFNVTMSNFPYTMKVSFTGTGNTEYEGDGAMEADEALPNWKWTARIGGLAPTRMMVDGKAYGTPDPVPMRVQMVREALFRPIPGSPNQKAIRVADVDYNGKQVRCILLAGNGPRTGVPREWWDREYCVDSSNGRLLISSEAAGVYVVYDYTNAVDFHGHGLPRQITFFQGEKTVLDIHVDSMKDGVEDQATLFSPAAVESLVGPTFFLASAQWTRIRVDENPQGSLVRIEPVIVHATVSNDTGKVLEAEAVGSSNLSDRAVEIVRGNVFSPTGFQRDLYIAVEFYVRQ
jgi:hypothetical protein